MAGVSVDEGDLPKIAEAAGKAGKELPAWASGKPALEAAYYRGAGVTPPAPAPAPKPAAPAPKTPPSTPATADGAEDSSGSGAVDLAGKKAAQTRSVAPSSPTGPTFKIPGVKGDAGGILLAIWLYPIVLATLLHGPTGATTWLKAKFLNQVAGATSTPSKRVKINGVPGLGVQAGGGDAPTKKKVSK